MLIRLLRSSRGVSLVVVLIAAAVISVIVVGLLSMYDSMTGVMAKRTLSDDADNLARLVQGMVQQKELCGRALNGTVFNGSTDIDVAGGELQMRPAPGVAGSLVARVGMGVGSPTSSIQVSRIHIRPRIDPNTGEPLAAWDAPTNYVREDTGVAHQAYSGTLILEFAPTGGQAPTTGGNLKSRYIPIIFGVAGGIIDDCPGIAVEMAGYDCRTQMGASCDAEATAMATATGFPCSAYYFLTGFDSTGRAICDCDVTCDMGRPATGGAAAGAANPAAGGGGAAGGRGASSGGAN